MKNHLIRTLPLALLLLAGSAAAQEAPLRSGSSTPALRTVVSGHQRAGQALDLRARNGAWSARQHAATQQKLDGRARGAIGARRTGQAFGGGRAPAAATGLSPAQRAHLDRALRALERRARAGGWSPARIAQARRELVRRARAQASSPEPLRRLQR